MNKIDYYETLPYRLEITPDTEEGGYVASYPELPGCLTCGETVEETIKNAEDAKKAWLEAAIDMGIKIEEPDNKLDYSGQFKLRMPKSLHRELVKQAQEEGISMNQYCIYLLSKNMVLNNNLK